MNPRNLRVAWLPEGVVAPPRLAEPAAAPSLGDFTFTATDQRHFAELSGDFNPMHMDALAARRTQAGSPVVHGIHGLLRALDLLALHAPDLPPIATLKPSFNRLTYVGDTVNYRLTERSATAATIDAAVDGVDVSRLRLTFGPERPAPSPLPAQGTEVQRPETALDLTMDEMVGMSGRVGAAATGAQLAAAFPAAAQIWSSERMLALVCSTVLVGMVCPGLHSIYSALTLNAAPPGEDNDALTYRVTKIDPRFRLARMQVEGCGVWGSIDSFVRVPPTAQAAIANVAGLVAADEFAGSTALIVGGSRGLGELTAKILAAGGAHVIITYASGRADATACADAIRAWGGKCDVLQYDVRQPAAAQLTQLPAAPTHLYYMATPPIARRKAGLFAADRYAELQAFYVTGFYNLFQNLYGDGQEKLAVFYPSTVYVEGHSADLAEYAMAKTAGEVLAAAVTTHLPNAHVIINRLPPLPTDQNATVIHTETADPIATMLPIIRAVQS